MATQVRCVVDKVATDMDAENFQRNFPIPSFTGAQIAALVAPTEGMMVKNSTTNKLNIYLNGAWAAVTSV